MAGHNENMDQFETFFRRADVDGDGRISGAEAVNFFQGSGLSKQVLAQIWMNADQSHCGFLGRQEFYNALKLVTVSQSKRELTPDIVKAAIYGPAAAKIPPPQINPTSPASQFNSMGVASGPQMGSVASPTSQNFGFRGPGSLNSSMNQQYFPSQQSQSSVRSPQAMSVGVSRPPMAGPEYRGTMLGQSQPMPTNIGTRPPQVEHAITPGPASLNPSISNDWFGRTGGSPTGLSGMSPTNPSAALSPQTLVSTSLQPTTSKALVLSGNGNASASNVAGDMFSTAVSLQNKQSSSQVYSASSTPTSTVVPVSSGSQPASKINALDSLAAFSMQPSGGQHLQNRSPVSSGQQIYAQSSTSPVSPGASLGVGSSVSGNNQLQWPKMKPADVQKYSKVFMEVDTDRDGKITGEEARNLFLSWRLPREVLKQVWDLSDQDNDSMLSLREFCFALYLMERYREGRPLPGSLPNNLMYDETLLSMTGQPNMSYGNAAWGGRPGFGHQQGMCAQPVGPAAGMRPSVPGAPHFNGGTTPGQQKLQLPVSGDTFTNQTYNGEENSLTSTLQEVTSTGEMVGEEVNVVMDSKEKMEFYRTKMQDIVLHKSRCDNRLNEITERASADKREAETLGKKYEERYKQVAEIASKLTIEDARFHEVQERKKELQQAIINMEQGGSTDGILQVSVDSIQSDLEELMKALTERSKKHGFDVKSIALIELPTGWQPGIQEGAALWDEDWDKFEDEGFTNEMTFDAKNGSPEQNGSPNQNGSPIGSLTGDALFESEYAHSEDETVRSPVSSSAARTAAESLSPEYSDIHHEKSGDDAETQMSFDDSTWGAFNDNEDIDSVWGSNHVKNKDSDTESHVDFYGSSDFGVNPTGTDSPNAESSYQRKGNYAFDDSVPSTPMSKFEYSPPRFSEASNFDSFSRFDSFNNHDTGFSTQPNKLSRFDSMNSSKDFGGFSNFDSMNSPRDYGTNSSSTREFGGGEKLTRFDSINSSRDFGGSQGFGFEDTDSFGSSAPFKVSSDDKSPKEEF